MMDTDDLVTRAVDAVLLKPDKGPQKPSVRMRPLLRSVSRSHVIPYLLSMADKHVFNLVDDNVYLIPILESVRTHLLQKLREDKKDQYDFTAVQALSLECLQKAAELCRDPSTMRALSAAYHSWRSMDVYLDVTCIVNQRRRQEDRWFATADLLKYALDSNGLRSELTSADGAQIPLCAVGVFDGHNGAEAAEHCSHLSPWLLSLGLRQQLREGKVCITDLLANLFHRLNQSVMERRKSMKWSSGATATVCAIYADRIYTAWVGDSQAWLIYADGEINGTGTEATAEDQTVNGEATVEKTNGLQTGPMNHVNYESAVALTDKLHRPEFAPEFISVVRDGGNVSTEVEINDKSCKRSFSSAAVKTNAHSNPDYIDTYLNTQSLQFDLPPLSHPNLLDCRVGGLSCVSRAIGDDQSIIGMSSLPSVSVWQREAPGTVALQQPLCLILATDGLWDTDKCSGPEVAAITQHWFHVNQSPTTTGIVKKGLAQELTQRAVQNGASDNVSCVVVWLNGWARCGQPNHVVDASPGQGIRWPRGTRATSLVDFQSCAQLGVRGPNSPSNGGQRSSMLAELDHRKEIRFSSPPRYAKPIAQACAPP